MTADSIETKTKKRVREFEVVATDRVKMVEAANEFVAHMVNKQVLPRMCSGYEMDTSLDGHEQATYSAALDFLRRQFDRGHCDTEVFDKRNETEYEFPKLETSE